MPATTLAARPLGQSRRASRGEPFCGSLVGRVLDSDASSCRHVGCLDVRGPMGRRRVAGVDGNTTLGAMCIFVGGGASFVTVAWLRHGREGGENGFVEFVIGFLTRAVAHRVASFGYPVGPAAP